MHLHLFFGLLLRTYVAFALALRASLHALADRLVPSPLPLYDMAAGVVRTQVLATFVTLGLAEALQAGDKSLDELSKQARASPPMLARFLRMGEAMGLVKRRRSGAYRGTRLARALCNTEPTSVAAFASYLASESNVAAWGALTDVVRTGTDAFSASKGMSVWQYFQEHSAEEKTFAQAMAALAHIEGPLVARAYPFGRHRLLCDVGGGSGTFLRTLLRVHQGAQGMVFDQATIVDAAREQARSAQGGRIAYVPGNFFVSVPSGADALILRQILHDWNDDACAIILRNCCSAMAADGRLLIIDSRLEPSDASPLIALKDLTMAVVCGGRERSRADMEALLARCGLSLVRVWPTAAPVAVWEVARQQTPPQST